MGGVARWCLVVLSSAGIGCSSDPEPQSTTATSTSTSGSPGATGGSQSTESTQSTSRSGSASTSSAGTGGSGGTGGQPWSTDGGGNGGTSGSGATSGIGGSPLGDGGAAGQGGEGGMAPVQQTLCEAWCAQAWNYGCQGFETHECEASCESTRQVSGSYGCEAEYDAELACLPKADPDGLSCTDGEVLAETVCVEERCARWNCIFVGLYGYDYPYPCP